jgi:hypothetical protein
LSTLGPWGWVKGTGYFPVWSVILFLFVTENAMGLISLTQFLETFLKMIFVLALIG